MIPVILNHPYKMDKEESIIPSPDYDEIMQFL